MIIMVFNRSIDMLGAKEKMDEKVTHVTGGFKKSLSLATKESEHLVFLQRR